MFFLQSGLKNCPDFFEYPSFSSNQLGRVNIIIFLMIRRSIFMYNIHLFHSKNETRKLTRTGLGPYLLGVSTGSFPLALGVPGMLYQLADYLFVPVYSN